MSTATHTTGLPNGAWHDGNHMALQILQRAPAMADFRMASSRVGAEGGIALAQGLSAGQHPRRCRNLYGRILSGLIMLLFTLLSADDLEPAAALYY